MLVVAVVTIAAADGWIRVMAAGVLGFLAAIAIAIWTAGGHVSNLTWSWGAEGERRTGALLEKLGGEWHVEHDIAHARGNWDHVVIGLPGVFVIDSKAYHGPATVVGDELRSGRLRTRGAVFRGQAVGLKETLEQATGHTTWVQAVVAIHGDFQSGVVENDNVAYLDAERLVEWLRARPPRLRGDSRDSLGEALSKLRATSWKATDEG